MLVIDADKRRLQLAARLSSLARRNSRGGEYHPKVYCGAYTCARGHEKAKKPGLNLGSWSGCVWPPSWANMASILKSKEKSSY